MAGVRRTAFREAAYVARGQGLVRLSNSRPQNLFDADAWDYIRRVEAADNYPLEDRVRVLIDLFVCGCKADSTWTPIKASCLMVGARTLAGALTPLVGSAPTNNNFVAGDYSRTTGLLGNGSSKYLNTNRNNNADPQNSCHVAVYATSVGATTATNKIMLGGQIGGTNEKLIIAGTSVNSGNASFRCQTTGTIVSAGAARFAPGLIGASRASSSQVTLHNSGGSTTVSSTSTAPSSGNLGVFASFNGTAGQDFDDSRLAFYSVGEAVDLLLLNRRLFALTQALPRVIA